MLHISRSGRVFYDTSVRVGAERLFRQAGFGSGSLTDQFDPRSGGRQLTVFPGSEDPSSTTSFTKAYSRLSISACRLASMMLSFTPTVPHSALPSVVWMSTRVLAAVPVLESMMRTL